MAPLSLKSTPLREYNTRKQVAEVARMWNFINKNLVRSEPVFVPEKTGDRPLFYAFPPSKKLFTSMDVDCLKNQTLMLFAQFPIQFVEHHEPHFSPNGNPM
jgi:hypothetical protein